MIRSSVNTGAYQNKTGRGCWPRPACVKSNLSPIATGESLREQRESDRAKHWFLLLIRADELNGPSDGMAERGLYVNVE